MLLGDIHTSSKNKKRKSAEVEEGGEGEENQSAASQRAVFSELVLRSEHVLSSVKSACVHDSEGFIDEVPTRSSYCLFCSVLYCSVLLCSVVSM